MKNALFRRRNRALIFFGTGFVSVSLSLASIFAEGTLQDTQARFLNEPDLASFRSPYTVCGFLKLCSRLLFYRVFEHHVDVAVA